jgi:hypothetical protein
VRPRTHAVVNGRTRLAVKPTGALTP